MSTSNDTIFGKIIRGTGGGNSQRMRCAATRLSRMHAAKGDVK
jgi:hypothetical protein